ncbi:MAG: hypothetical protein ACUVT7_01055 [Thermoplasmata archaeon]
MSGLLELFVTLGAYRRALVLAGGWVPYFLLRDCTAADIGAKHVGSIDIDLVVDPSMVGANEYATIVELIARRGWVPSRTSLFSFEKSIPSPVDGRLHRINVDFLAPEPSLITGKHRHTEVQEGLKARAMAGAELALSHRIEIAIEGHLPGGGEVRTRLQMADVVGFIGTKGLALGERYSEKDAYDLFSVVENFGSGPEEIAASMEPFLGDPLMFMAIENIREKFGTRDSAGCEWVAAFFPELDGEGRQLMATRAFMVVSRFLEALEGSPSVR